MNHQPRPVRRTDLAAKKGVGRSAVSLACRPGGPLAAAVLPGGRVDGAHPATIAWLGRSAYSALDWAGLPSTAITIEEFAKMAGVSLEQAEIDLQSPEFEGAIIESPIDLDHPEAQAFIAQHRQRP